ncbi:MAG: hypothetical protein IPH04_06655 [Saprospirales bacterium]|nr:hypothetical protein [Saprospirales bacterium]
MSVERQLYRASIGLLIEYPYFGALLSELVKEVSPASTQSIAIRYEEPVFVLSVNPECWEQRIPGEGERMGSLLHQVLHLFFGHPWPGLGLTDRFLSDVAADLAVNQFIPTHWLPEDAVLPGGLAEFPLAPHQSLLHYYEKLEALLADGGRQYPMAFSTLMQWYEHRETLFESHDSWYRSSPGKKLDKELARWSARSLIRQTAVAAGEKALAQLPAALRLELGKEAPGPSQEINWRKLLRQFAQSSRSTYLKETIRRPSKRYGTTPGIRLRRRQRLLVAVDTSGSVSKEEQAAFFEEIRFLGHTGAEITLLEFDLEIQQISKYKGRQPAFLLGGGGTSFLPVLEYANKSGPWDGVILFTDGFAPIPRLGIRPPILWAITAGGLSPATSMYRALPGLKLKLREGVEKSNIFGV